MTCVRFSPAYWNATRAFMILSAMSCFAGIITGIMSFAHFSSFERFNRSFAAGIMFFVSSESLLLLLWNWSTRWWTVACLTDAVPSLSQLSLFCWVWPSTRGWQSTSWESALVTGASPGPTYWAGWPCSWPSSQVRKSGLFFPQIWILIVNKFNLTMWGNNLLCDSLALCVAGIFYICAYRMCECRRGNGPR